MGFLQSVIGNASKITIENAEKEWSSILAKDEKIEVAYKLVRDYFIFTKNRLILIDVQGITGKKIEIISVPFRSIVAFSVETAGVLDSNAELCIWVASTPFAIKKTFNKDVNIYEVQAVLAEAIAFIPSSPPSYDIPNPIPSYDIPNPIPSCDIPNPIPSCDMFI